MLGKTIAMLVLAGALALGFAACGEGGVSDEGGGDEIVKPMEDYRGAAEEAIDDSNADKELEALEQEIDSEGE